MNIKYTQYSEKEKTVLRIGFDIKDDFEEYISKYDIKNYNITNNIKCALSDLIHRKYNIDILSLDPYCFESIKNNDNLVSANEFISELIEFSVYNNYSNVKTKMCLYTDKNKETLLEFFVKKELSKIPVLNTDDHHQRAFNLLQSNLKQFLVDNPELTIDKEKDCIVASYILDDNKLAIKVPIPLINENVPTIVLFFKEQ